MCNHTCKDKARCKHKCCKVGLTAAAAPAAAATDSPVSTGSRAGGFDIDSIDMPPPATRPVQAAAAIATAAAAARHHHSPLRANPNPPRLTVPSKSMPLPSRASRDPSPAHTPSASPLIRPSESPATPSTPRQSFDLSRDLSRDSNSSQSSQSGSSQDTADDYVSERTRKERERAAADERRNRERRAEEERIRAQIAADRERVRAERAAATAAANAAAANAAATANRKQSPQRKGGSAQRPNRPLSTAVTPLPNELSRPDMGEAPLSGYDLSSDAASPIRAGPPPPPPQRSLILRIVSHPVGIAILALLTLYTYTHSTAFRLFVHTVWSAFVALLSALAAVLSTTAGSLTGSGSCSLVAPASIRNQFASLVSQPSFADGRPPLATSQPLAVRLVSAALSVSLAYDGPADSRAIAAAANSEKAAHDAGNTAIRPPTTVQPSPLTESEIFKRIARDRSNGLTVVHFAGSAPRDQQRMIDTVIASAYRGSASSSGAVLTIRSELWDSQFTASGRSSDAERTQMVNFQRIVHLQLCACERVLIVVSDAQRLPNHLLRVIESVLDTQTLRVRCESPPLTDANALAAAVLAASAPVLMPAASSGDAELPAEREIDMSGSLLVLMSDIAAADLVSVAPATAATAPESETEIESTIQAATNRVWNRKAFVGRITMNVPFVGTGSKPTAAAAAAPAATASTW